MRLWVLTLSLALIPSLSHAQANYTGPAGGGMMAVQEADVLEPGHFTLGMVYDNYDRDPLGLDVTDIRLAGRLAVVKGLEFSWRYDISRAVCAPGAHPVPPGPLDIVSVNMWPPPHAPYRSMYWPMPYLGHESCDVSTMTPGQYVFGLKALLTHQRGWRPATAVSLDVTIPGDMSAESLKRGSSNGRTSIGLHLATTWKYRRLSTSANLGYTFNDGMSSGQVGWRYLGNHTGKPRADRLIVSYDGSSDDSGTGQVFEDSGRLPDVLQGGLGLRLRVWRGISLMAEGYGSKPVGLHTPVQNDAGASDVLGGIQISVKAFTLTAGVRQHLSPPRDHSVLSTGPLSGALNLSVLSDEDQRRYLADIGVDQSTHRPGANLVIVGGRNGIPDPPGSKRIPDTYLTHTTGNTGFACSVSISF